jgi:murein DD-endopeptidase MepM/ murein hydrolase activator NlpD
MMRTSSVVASVAALGAAAVVYAAVFTGPRDLAAYPEPEDSPYRLPFPDGRPHLCAQGNRGVFTHRGDLEYAYDFAMPVGSPVHAARAGEVIEVDVSHDGIGNYRGNQIRIRHDDGSVAVYAHLQHRGSSVAQGDRVAQGQRIGSSGTTGRSVYPHLHFQVDRDGRSFAISFGDVPEDHGVPRAGSWYTAKAAAPAPPAP